MNVCTHMKKGEGIKLIKKEREGQGKGNVETECIMKLAIETSRNP